MPRLIGIDHVQLGMPAGGEDAARAFYGGLLGLRERLTDAGVTPEDDDSGLPIRRCYVADPFGNRVDLVDAADAGFTGRS